MIKNMHADVSAHNKLSPLHKDKVHLPEPFLALIKSSMPAHLSMDEFIDACQRPLRKSIRVNTLKISVDDFLTLTKQYDWQLTPIPWCEHGFWIERGDESVSLGNTAEHLAGLFYIQEASSMLPPMALVDELTANTRLLDMAAAPGSKTTQIASLMNNQGGIVANEYSASRVKVLSANLQRCGVANTAITHFDARVFGTWLPEQFDAILLDAPCSGEGAVRKDLDAMKNWSLPSVDEIAQTQKDLIESAFQALKPNGVLIYSTCTLNTQENQQVCLHLKQIYGDSVHFEPLNDLFAGADQAITEHGFLHVYPQIFDSEGFFVAKIRKLSSVPTTLANKRLGKFPFIPANKESEQQVKQALQHSFSLTISNELTLWQRDKELWLFPASLVPFIGEIKFSRIGIKLADVVISSKQKTPIYRWTHQAIIALTPANHTHMVELNTAQAREWFMGKDVRLEAPNSANTGEVIVSYQRYVIGLGKWVGNRIKNGRPRELVLDNLNFG